MYNAKYPDYWSAFRQVAIYAIFPWIWIGEPYTYLHYSEDILADYDAGDKI